MFVFGLITSFILVSAQRDNPFYPLIFGTGSFIILVILETMLSIELRKYIFAQIEEYLDNTYKYSIKELLYPGYFDNEKLMFLIQKKKE